MFCKCYKLPCAINLWQHSRSHYDNTDCITSCYLLAAQIKFGEYFPLISLLHMIYKTNTRKAFFQYKKCGIILIFRQVCNTNLIGHSPYHILMGLCLPLEDLIVKISTRKKNQGRISNNR